MEKPGAFALGRFALGVYKSAQLAHRGTTSRQISKQIKVDLGLAECWAVGKIETPVESLINQSGK